MPIFSDKHITIFMKKYFLLLVFLSLCLTSFAQKGDVGLFVYDYEKVSDVIFDCDIYVCTTNGGNKDAVIEVRGISVHYSKEKVKEWIGGIQALIDSKTGKTKIGKRTSIFILSDGVSTVYFNEKGECVFKAGLAEKIVTSQDAAKKILDGLKLAYEKL